MRLTRFRILLASAATAGLAGAQQLTLVSVSSAGAQSDGYSRAPSLSADGRFVAFQSVATTLTPPPHAPAGSVYLHDRANGVTTCVSAPTLGGATPDGPAECSAQAISGDGRYVVFWTSADNIGWPNSGLANDVLVRDVSTGQLEFISVKPNGQGGVGESQGAVISRDGLRVAFSSTGPNLIAGDSNHREDVFVRDRVAGVTTRVSIGTGGIEGDGRSWLPSMTGDARYVAFMSNSTNFVANDTNGESDVFVHDRQTGVTVRASQSSAGVVGDAASAEPAIALDGRYVAFESHATNLAPVPGSPQVFVHDLVTGTTTRFGTLGGVGDGQSYSPILSADGRRAAFRSTSSQLGYPQTTPPVGELYEQDLATGALRLITQTPAGAPSGVWSGYDSAYSEDGRYLAIVSGADWLVAGDANQENDILIDGGPWCAPPESYCTSGTTSNGCVATMASSGSARVGASSGFTLTVSGVDGNRPGLVFYGTGGAHANAWGQGSSWLCVKAPSQRTGVQNSGGTNGQCDGSLSVDWLAYIANNPGALGAPFSAGDLVWAQGWFRDPAASKATSLSDGLRFLVCP